MDPVMIIIVLVCMVGLGYSSYQVGFNQGTVATIQYLEDLKMIKFDEDGNIKKG